MVGKVGMLKIFRTAREVCMSREVCMTRIVHGHAKFKSKCTFAISSCCLPLTCREENKQLRTHTEKDSNDKYFVKKGIYVLQLCGLKQAWAKMSDICTVGAFL
jgi:hypothetical protein